LKGTFWVGAVSYVRGSKRLEDFDFMARYEIRNKEAERCIHDLIFQLSFRKSTAVLVFTQVELYGIVSF
jgi:hypothetical protein